jgi:hypothetical protein
MYSFMSASGTGPNLIVRRAVNPVEMPKSMRPGASWFNEASVLAAAGANRFRGEAT